MSTESRVLFSQLQPAATVRSSLRYSSTARPRISNSAAYSQQPWVRVCRVPRRTVQSLCRCSSPEFEAAECMTLFKMRIAALDAARKQASSVLLMPFCFLFAAPQMLHLYKLSKEYYNFTAVVSDNEIKLAAMCTLGLVAVSWILAELLSFVGVLYYIRDNTELRDLSLECAHYLLEDCSDELAFKSAMQPIIAEMANDFGLDYQRWRANSRKIGRGNF